MADIPNYRPRVVDEKISRLMQVFGAVSLTGLKACGKTACGYHHSVTQINVAKSEGSYNNIALAEVSPALLIKGKERPLFIDEYTEVDSGAPIFDYIRTEVDNAPPGQFLLAGSYAPSGMLHSGAGRITSVRMLTMSQYELGNSDCAVSLQALFENEGHIDPTPLPELALPDILGICGRGGWPHQLAFSHEARDDYGNNLATGYLEAVIDNDVQRVGAFKRMPNRNMLSAILKAMATNDASVTSSSELISCVSTYGAKVSKPTILTYLDIFSKLYLIEEQPGFMPNVQVARSLLSSPKRRFSDPSLIFAALDINPQAMIRDAKMISTVYDNLCVHDLKVYAEANDGRVCHYRDNYGLTADSIIRRKDGSWCAFKHCVGANEIDKCAEELLKIKKVFSAAGDPATFVGVICATAAAAYTRPDGVAVFPITALMP